MSRKFFGTDGIRGAANQMLTADLALAAGRAAVAVLPAARPRILIGRDTRVSGPMLEAALVAGISSAGGEPIRAGVIPTPAVASLVIDQNADAGAVISASHNPYQDNGIKFFGASGFKLTDEQEVEMERYLTGEEHPPVPDDPGAVSYLKNAYEVYVDHLLARNELDLSGLRILIDCANGATYESAPLAFERLNARATVIADRPDGFNINDGCGSTHVHGLRDEVLAGGFDVGLAFDGDGDRVIAIDASGNVIDGDFIMAICGNFLKDKGKLPKNTIVTTVMTNLGFHMAMNELGIEVRTTAVGDRYVLEDMLAGGYGFGGEQSGHLINLETGTTGDGLATALLLLQAMTETGIPLNGLAKIMERLPQRLVNVRVADMSGLKEAAGIWEKVETETSRLGDEGRVLVRPSGTEPVVRVMVEAATLELCDEICAGIVSEVESCLGTTSL
ncbi:MAG: phosphoglucosamine mutase [Thermoleophilia bacterium]